MIVSLLKLLPGRHKQMKRCIGCIVGSIGNILSIFLHLHRGASFEPWVAAVVVLSFSTKHQTSGTLDSVKCCHAAKEHAHRYGQLTIYPVRSG